MHEKLALLGLTLLLSGGAASAAQMYRWTDTNGRVHFSDRRPPAHAAEISSLETGHSRRSGSKLSENSGSWALHGEVTRVRDGDSLDVSAMGATLQLRLHGIDAPEHKQPHGETAKHALKRMAMRKPARLRVKDTDRYGRNIARVQVQSSGRWLDLNREMVQRGHAWVYRKFNDDPALLGLEQQARLSRRGLWAKPKPVAPWEWRRRKPRQ